MIYEITPEMLDHGFLRTRIYPDLTQTCYWTKTWDRDFYIELARAGFISISHEHATLGTLLIPELQKSYAVLDWENLHRSRRIRNLMRSSRLEDEGIELRITRRVSPAIARIVDYHGPTTWLSPPYAALLENLQAGVDPDFALHATELWSREHDALIAGEIGYTIGPTYTSLSGFTTRPDRQWRDFGTLQMVMLAERLQQCGYSFWNMGHTQQRYKIALGARVIPRKQFLRRWFEAECNRPLRVSLGADALDRE